MKKGKPVPKYSHLPQKFLEKKLEDGKTKLRNSLEVLEGDGLIHRGVISGFVLSLIPILLLDWLLFRRGSQSTQDKDGSKGLTKEEEDLQKELDAERRILKNEMKKLASKKPKTKNPVHDKEGEEEVKKRR